MEGRRQRSRGYGGEGEVLLQLLVGFRGEGKLTRDLERRAAGCEEMVRGKEQKKNLLVSSFAPTDSLPPDNIPQPPLDQSVVGPSVLLSTIPVLLPPCGAADAAFEPPPRLVRLFRVFPRA